MYLRIGQNAIIMKLRCTENSIRLRLRKSDITALAEHGKIRETVQFPTTQSLSFELRLSPVNEISAALDQATIIVDVPQEAGKDWINSNQVGIEKELSLTSNASLHILIEKDFPCKDRPDEDKSDTFEELASEEGAAC